MNKYIVGGVVATGLAGLTLLYSGCGRDPMKNVPAKSNAPSKLEERTQSILVHDGVRIDVFASETSGLQSGMNFSVESYKRDEWLPYVPIELQIPSINYSAPLPIQSGMSSAKLTLKTPEKLIGEKLYVVGEKNGRRVVLYETNLGGKNAK